jgi:hypothetical protein
MGVRVGLKVAVGIMLAALLGACAAAPMESAAEAMSPDAPAISAALDGIKGDQIQRHMTVLADDKLEGRGLGSEGYESALQYIETSLKSYGLAPAGESGGFRQRVPLRNNVVTQNASSMSITSAAGSKTLEYGKDYLLSADPLREQVGVDNAAVVFAGYGVSAPALGYDDYAAGVDVKGKVVAYLSGAPAMLPSNERAYYSSGPVKEAEAIKRGAIGIVSFTSPDDPRFRWDVSVATSASGSYAWINAQGLPNRGDAALRGSATLNHSGVAARRNRRPRCSPLRPRARRRCSTSRRECRWPRARRTRTSRAPTSWRASRAATRRSPTSTWSMWRTWITSGGAWR